MPAVRVVHFLYRVSNWGSPERSHYFNLIYKTMISYTNVQVTRVKCKRKLSFNIVRKKRSLSSNRAVNTLRLGYKNQSVNVV